VTTLVIGKVAVGVVLFTTTAKPGKLAEFTTAGPNGGVLFQRDEAAEKPLSSDEPVPEMVLGKSDPLADDPGSEAPPIEDPGTTMADAAGIVAQTLTPGEYKKVLVEEGTDKVVKPEEVRKGVRLVDGSFVDCTAQLAAIETETKLERMEVVDFIDVGQVERARVESSYYIGAGEPKSAKPLKLIYEAMKTARRAAVVKWSNRSRQSLGVLTAHGNSGCLVLLKLAWAEDWREPPAKALTVASARVSLEEVTMAVRLVEAMSGKAANMDKLRDDAIALREGLYDDALAGKVEAIEPPPVVDEDVELEDAFAASLEALVAAPRAGKS
jgi:non-homologous end joining protein Ku